MPISSNLLNLDRCLKALAHRNWKTEIQTDGCIYWIGGCTPSGYGTTSVCYLPHGSLVHRVVLVVKLGRDIEPGMHAGHTCHDEAVARGECVGGSTCLHRRCVNPEHLVEQSPKQNTNGGAASRRLTPRSPRVGVGGGRPCKRGHASLRGKRSQCITCRDETLALIAEAAHSLGMTRADYLLAHGGSRSVAEAIIRARDETISAGVTDHSSGLISILRGPAEAISMVTVSRRARRDREGRDAGRPYAPSAFSCRRM